MSTVDFNTHCSTDLFPFLGIEGGNAPLEQQFASLATRITHCHTLAERLYGLFGEMAERGGSAELVRQGDSLAYALVTILSDFPQEIEELQLNVEKECRE